MTNDQIIRKIAKACGWKTVYTVVLLNGEEKLSGVRKGGHVKYIPNYTESNDAMQEALGTLDNEELSKYALELFAEVLRGKPKHCEMQVAMLLATPRQKAKAFLLAKGLWEDFE